MTRVFEKLGSQVLPREFEVTGIENTPQYDPYEDKTQKGDHNIGAEILLPRGDEMARGHVVAQSHNTSGNIIGRVYVKPILNTRIHQVEFAGGKVSELTTNVTAKSMYVQCNA